MLGIYLLVCMAVYFLIELKVWSLTRGGSKAVVLSPELKTYEVCRLAVRLRMASNVVVLAGFLGCAWPYLLIQDASLLGYIIGIVSVTAFLVFLILFSYRNRQDVIQISMDEVVFQGKKTISVKISDIHKITCPFEDAYKIFFNDKKRRPVNLCAGSFYKKKEIYFLMKHLRDLAASANGKETSLAHKVNVWPLAAICQKGVKLLLVPCLIYTSCCCIDYDFALRDYTEQYNALNAEAGQADNAWPYYVQAAANCVELEESLQNMIETSQDADMPDFTDNRKEELKSWFLKNAASWECLKKAASIDYCNAVYEQISLLSSKGRRDFSNATDDGYAQIRDLYRNLHAGTQSNVFELNRLELLQMQITSSRHFIYGKSYVDQLNGYAMLQRSVDLLAGQERYKPEDLHTLRALLKKQFPAGVPTLNTEGEILVLCSSFDDMYRLKRIPVQSPLNPIFLLMGSRTGSENYIRNYHAVMLKKAREGAQYQPVELSMFSFPFMRKALFCILEGNTYKLYQHSQKANTTLMAAYVLLDLEEYRLSRGSYPADISQLKEAGFQGELPDDIDSGGKIIYCNDEQRVVLYAAGYNAKDDGGYHDPRGSDGRDDIIYWERKLK